MGVITIEFAEIIAGDPCPCCGGRTTRLTRFVYSDGDAHAVYYAAFSDKHTERVLSALVSLGEWGEGSKPTDRVAFAVSIRATEADYRVTVVDATKSLWHDAKFLGRMLDRKAALKHRWIKEVFHITDHIVTEDEVVQDYLNGKTQVGEGDRHES
jgi:hypothetical protein